MKADSAKTAIESLTPRERQLLTAISEGHSLKEIAESFELRPKTVKNQVSAMLKKLDCAGSSTTAVIMLSSQLPSPTTAKEVNLSVLDDHELAILSRVAQGRTVDSIAHEFQLSRKTVSAQKKTAVAKLGLAGEGRALVARRLALAFEQAPRTRRSARRSPSG